MANTETKTTEKNVAAVATEAPVSQLPAVITQQVLKQGDLIDIAGFTSDQMDQARSIAEGFSLSNTSDILNFAAEPQRSMSSFLDELLADIRVKDAGIAGDMSMQMAEGIDLMRLGDVRGQIENPPSNGWFARMWRAVTGWKNYVHAFYAAQKPVTTMITKIVKMAENRIVTLTAHSDKLDRQTERASQQVKDLSVWIAAGEAIVIGAIQQYNEERTKVLESKDPLAASQLRDMARQVAAFETRLLETKIAYVEAGSVTIPRIRQVQEAIVIEIQNISGQILFQIPKFKAAIVLVAALDSVAEAQKQRAIMDENERKLDKAMGGLVTSISEKAKESQGSPLAKVQALEAVIDDIKTGIESGIALEEKTRAQRAEAGKILVGLKDVVTEALKGADLSAAEA